MKELLDNIQKLIEKNINESVSIQKKLLGPLFSEVYDLCRGSETLDIKDMLKLSQLENQLTKRIIEVNPIVESSFNSNEVDKTIEQIIYYSRKQAEAIYHCSVINDSLRERSLDFCNIVLEISKNLGVATCSFNLGALFNLPIKHYVVVAHLENNYYLIDITYQQFFLLGYNFENRYYEHPSYTRVCEVGGRMLSSRKETAANLIRKGYIQTEVEFKQYFDAFMEFGSQNKLDTGYDYLKILIHTLKGSSEKSEKILYSKMNF